MAAAEEVSVDAAVEAVSSKPDFHIKRTFKKRRSQANMLLLYSRLDLEKVSKTQRCIAALCWDLASPRAPTESIKLKWFNQLPSEFFLPFQKTLSTGSRPAGYV